MVKTAVMLLCFFVTLCGSLLTVTQAKAATGNASSFFEVSLRYFDEQLLLDILPRATCPGEDEGSPMDEFADLFTVSDEDDDADGMPESIYAYPRDASGWMQFWWIFVFPIKFTLSLLIPHPMKYRRLYPLSFIMCILCIGGNAYLIVWMLTAFGVAIHVPTIVMGLTFLAAGSTMPEAVSSLISLRNGENGIGVSNSLGANSLAILLSLGVPWFIKNCINYGTGEPQQVGTQGIEYNILILIISTVALFIILSFSGYRLTKRVGVALFTVYGVFIVLQILIEMNVFFPRDCSS
ncbi:probable sodium/potassium/calcium exchanger CG1090 isoform X4 [Drosophila yakuba]|uniref:probable sodium/potassium/calcium exchanger CG1090 isoform X4 n=1 Tax=Drosophila yakuba TaxID=7245 RepID=UPI0019307D12|nr:probable sodium/potassium/calcium exchanger CG1090 isoform X4 [Drosophila yakuba]